MSKHYVFHESGSIPGIPGTFAGVRVEVADDGGLDVQPLPLHSHFEAAEEEEQVEEEEVSEEQSTEEAPEQSGADIPPEHQPEAVLEEQVETTEPEQPASLPEASPAVPVEGVSEQA